MPRKNKYKQRKDGRFVGFIQDGFKEDGRPNRIAVYGKTSKEVEDKVDALKHEIKSRHLFAVSKSGITVEDYSRKWLEKKKIFVGLNTYKMYENIVVKHIDDELGDILLCELSKADVEHLIQSRWEQVRTCEQILLTVRQIIDSAMDDGYSVDPRCVKKITLPKRKEKPKERALTDLERKALTAADFTDKERALVCILYGCGLRREEALALTRTDIDLKVGYININKVVIFDGNNPILKNTPKSISGIRKVNIPSWLNSILRRYLASIDTFLLFTNKTGDMVTKSGFDKLWKRVVDKMNLAAGGTDAIRVINGLTSKIFRHNYCTMLYYSGISVKKAAELMGHSDTQMIMRVYAHLDEEKERTQEKIEQAIRL